MTIKPGSSESDDAFADSMAEEIENALKMEWLAIKKELLPDAGKADRRLLFAAIAQGVLSYLKKHDPDFEIFRNPPKPPVIIIHSPRIELQLSSGNWKILGSNFPKSTNGTITWDIPSATAQQFATDSKGALDIPLTIPAGAKNGNLVKASVGDGNVALAVFHV